MAKPHHLLSRSCGVLLFTVCLWLMLLMYCDIASNGDWGGTFLLVAAVILSTPLSWAIPTVRRIKTTVRSEAVLTQEASYWSVFATGAVLMAPVNLLASVVVGMSLSGLGGGGPEWGDAIGASILMFLVFLVVTGVAMLMFTIPFHIWIKRAVARTRNAHRQK